MPRTLLALAALAGFLGVGAGAFGAHALRSRLPPELFEVFQTGVLYHLVHAVALGVAALAAARFPGALPRAAGWLFLAGIVVFSGSLYALALTGVRGFGAVTPFGGLAFLAGWVCLGLGALRGPGQRR